MRRLIVETSPGAETATSRKAVVSGRFRQISATLPSVPTVACSPGGTAAPTALDPAICASPHTSSAETTATAPMLISARVANARIKGATTMRSTQLISGWVTAPGLANCSSRLYTSTFVPRGVRWRLIIDGGAPIPISPCALRLLSAASFCSLLTVSDCSRMSRSERASSALSLASRAQFQHHRHHQ